ncbi:acetyl-coenzyme A synthetase N-terminal domain-containing protein, partial [Pseudonocardia yuanmonensis]|uniref:acetyl-coenzyme A synthetase N-terminal domain-containing protein n=1 Tax=Pseudonocardia yuanmonensis TaxID=1095914 RepID=UPI0031EFF988
MTVRRLTEGAVHRPARGRFGLGSGTGSGEDVRDREAGVGAYEDVFRASVEDREGFWLRAAEALDWHKAPTRALDDS